MRASSRHFRQPSPKKRKGARRQADPKPAVPPNQLYEPDVIASALERSRGMITVAARLLKCSRQTIYNAIQTYPEVKTALDDARELLLDTAELKLLEAISKGQAWAICFYLKTQGRKRGYVEKVDVSADSATLEELVLLSHKRQAEQRPKEQAGSA